MFVLKLDNNSFSGTVDLSQLPQGLELLILADNKLLGEFSYPDARRVLNVFRNTKIIKLT